MLQSLTLTPNCANHLTIMLLLSKKRVKSRKGKWLNAEIESEMNSRDQLHRNAQESRKEKIGQYIKNNATNVTI